MKDFVLTTVGSSLEIPPYSRKDKKEALENHE